MKMRARPLWVPPEPVPCEKEPAAWTDYPNRTEKQDPVRLATVEYAKAVCYSECLLRGTCLDEALADEGGMSAERRAIHGIRGGKSPGERQTIYKKTMKGKKP